MKKDTGDGDIPAVFVIGKKYVIVLGIVKALIVLSIAVLLFYVYRLFWVLHPKRVTGNQDGLLFQSGRNVSFEYDYAFLEYEYLPKTVLVPAQYKNQIWAVKLHGKDEFVFVLTRGLLSGGFDDGRDKRSFRTTEEFLGAEPSKTWLEKPLVMLGKTGKIEKKWLDGIKKRLEQGEKDGEGVPNTLWNTNLSCCLEFIGCEHGDYVIGYDLYTILTSTARWVFVIIFLVVALFLVRVRYKKEEKLVEWFRKKERMEQREKKKWYDMD